MDMHKQRVAGAGETGKVGAARLALVRPVDGVAVLAHPLTHLLQHAHRFFGNRSVTTWADVQQIISAIASA